MSALVSVVLGLCVQNTSDGHVLLPNRVLREKGSQLRDQALGLELGSGS